nr:alkaline phosphatase family protein [Candidatus Frankia alpina]
MLRSPTRRAVGMAASGLALSGLVAVSAATPAVAGLPEHTRSPARHVLLLSVDGLHQADLSAYVRTHPGSALAGLVGTGVSYTHASTPVPSDSFPGLIAQVTGGNPATTGIYYDDTFNHSLLPAGTTSCAGVKPGAEVAFTEGADRDQSSLDAGQGLAWAARQHPVPDRVAPDAARPEDASGRPVDLQAGLPALLPHGEHRLRGGTRPRAGHRLVGQAPRLRDPQRPVGHRRPGPVHP